MEIELTVLLLVEVYSPLHQIGNALWGVPYHLFHSRWVADKITSNHCVLDVLFEIVELQVRNAGYTALRLRSIGFIERCFAYESHLTLLCICHFQGIAHTSHTTTDNQEIEFTYHGIYVLLNAKLHKKG